MQVGVFEVCHCPLVAAFFYARSNTIRGLCSHKFVPLRSREVFRSSLYPWVIGVVKVQDYTRRAVFHVVIFAQNNSVQFEICGYAEQVDEV